MGCLHPRKNFYYHYSVFPAQLLKLLFLHLSHLFTLGRPGSRAGGWHITRPEAHGDLSTWLRCPGSRSTSSWTLALVKVSPELGTGKATVPGLAPDWSKATSEWHVQARIRNEPSFRRARDKTSKIQFHPNAVSIRSLWRKNLPPGRWGSTVKRALYLLSDNLFHI